MQLYQPLLYLIFSNRMAFRQYDAEARQGSVRAKRLLLLATPSGAETCRKSLRDPIGQLRSLAGVSVPSGVISGLTPVDQQRLWPWLVSRVLVVVIGRVAAK